jgi:hypothetical protein
MLFRITAKNFMGMREVGCCHDEPINKGGSLASGCMNHSEQFKGGSKRWRTVGKQKGREGCPRAMAG